MRLLMALATLGMTAAAQDEKSAPKIELTGYGVMVPASTPPALVARVQTAIATVLARPAVRERLAALGLVTVANKPDDFAAQIKRETATWATVIREAGVKAE